LTFIEKRVSLERSGWEAADQDEKDHESFVGAVRSGRSEAIEGI
jgi:hypothetical protein